MTKSILVLFVVVVLAVMGSCATGPPSESAEPGRTTDADQADQLDFMEDIARRTTQQTDSGDVYSALLPGIIGDLKNCQMMADDPESLMASYTEMVHAYAFDLEDRGYSDADQATVDNEAYWRAVIALPAGDITAMLVRLSLLMRDGQLKRSEIMLMFCLYDRNPAWERDGRILSLVQEDINRVSAESERLIEEGIAQWDRGERQAGIESYRAALGVFPKDPWALWELGHDRIAHDPHFPRSQDFENLYALIREIDPHYEMAWYQGQMTPSRRQWAGAVSDKILPAYQRLWGGEDSVANMHRLAEGYRVIGEYEFAFYALKYVLFHDFRGEFDDRTVADARTCLSELGMENVLPYFDEFLRDTESYMASMRR